MSRETWDGVDRYAARALIGDDADLEAVLQSSDAAGLPQIAVSPLQGKLLFLLARMIGARSILEIGTLGGYSTIWLARALPPDGRLVSLEAEPGYAEVARENVARAGFADVVDIRVGLALETLPGVEGPLDFAFIDADKKTTPEYFAAALELTRRGGVIIGDNVVRDGALLDQDGDASTQGMRRFIELMGAEPRVDATVIQTVGLKGYDGFALALVL
jgi:predicted O-methyltransferase YrrM